MAVPYNHLGDPTFTTSDRYAVMAIQPGAFRDTLRDGEQVDLRIGHGDDAVLASTGNGSLRLIDAPEGLLFTADCYLPADEVDTARKFFGKGGRPCSVMGRISSEFI